MKVAELNHDWGSAIAAISVAQIDWLLAQGMPDDVVRRCGPIGRARIYPDDPEKGLFTPADCGHGEDGTIDAIIQAVVLVPPGGHDGKVRLLDLLAWNPRTPDQWWLRIGGTATWLGEGAVVDACAEDWDEELMGYAQPGLMLYPTPLAWLQAGARNDGAVLLDDGGRLWRDLLAGADKVIVADEAFAEQVYKKIRKRPPTAKLPQVWLAGQELSEAAA